MIVTRYTEGRDREGIEQHPQGEYVRYDDYEELSNKLDDLINAVDESEQTLRIALNRAVKE